MDFGLLFPEPNVGVGVDVNKSSRTEQVAKQILSYYLRNPSAADSLEGIAQWRLLEEAIHRNVVETEGALQWLVNEQYLIETAQAHSGKLYRLNPEKLREANSLLDVPAKPQTGKKD